MLVLSRKKDEAIRIGDDIVVTVIRDGTNVRLGIEAPKEISVLRDEVWEREQDENRSQPAA